MHNGPLALKCTENKITPHVVRVSREQQDSGSWGNFPALLWTDEEVESLDPRVSHGIKPNCPTSSGRQRGLGTTWKEFQDPLGSHCGLRSLQVFPAKF